MRLTTAKTSSETSGWSPALSEKPQGLKITFDAGLLAFQSYRHFYLSHFPKLEFSPLMLLKSCERPDLAFLLYPMTQSSEITYHKEDMQEICDRSGLDTTHFDLYLVVTVRRGATTTHFTVNKRAPLIIDITTHRAMQVILSNAEYTFEAGLPQLSEDIARRRTPL